jgi:hypothetical protein
LNAALVTFDDDSTQLITGLTGGGTWPVPTNLSRAVIKAITFS